MKHITKPSKEALRYPVRIAWSDDDDAYVATAPDFPGAICAMDTESEALSEIRLILTGHLESMLEHGQAVPEPSAAETYAKARGMLSVSKIAAIMGVKRPTLASRIRRGRPPSREETLRLKKALAGLI